MPLLTHEIDQFRNLLKQQLSFNSKFNIIYGNNGSGKSSLLESIYLLGTGRSFRSYKLDTAITYNNNFFRVLGSTSNNQKNVDNISIQRSSGNQSKIQINNQPIKNSSLLAKKFPIISIDIGTFDLLTGGPQKRRQFIDWGVFHVEHGYSTLHKHYQKALNHRNILLKNPSIEGYANQLVYWTQLIADCGEKINVARKHYLNVYLELLNQQLTNLDSFIPSIGIDYNPGWDDSQSLFKVIENSQKRDEKYQTTLKGIHRANLTFTINKTNVESVLSRGQQKLLVYILKLTQALFYKKHKQGNCCVLIDDFGSEFDINYQLVVVDLIKKLDTQLFITVISQEEVNNLIEKFKRENATLFHVKQGLIELISF